ncbi:hypothetical protein BGW38_006068 [Lunasporangiospora selenospora]|uniref:Tr-type G domain-containing protein n=1 Tax=Lunasporangiospora selenospora TaxID=979761 RepID=A0A9P6KGZ3_9FUNG|nr:hypothetical protein BGW38_006068 [Lunasporangiospora selenospora]
MLKKDQLKDSKRSAESSLPLPSTSTTKVTSPDINDMDDPLAGFEAQRSGIKDISLKEQFLDPTESNIEALQTLFEARLREGSGETLFEIGIEEDGAPMDLTEAEFQTALSTVKTTAAAVGAEVAIMYEKATGPVGATATSAEQQVNDDDAASASEDNAPDSSVETSTAPVASTGSAEDGSVAQFKTAYVMIRKIPKSPEDLLELRVAVVGNVDAGKSTLLGVLTKGVLDDGRGKARVNLFRHKHEIDSGRTSSVGMEILGFDAKSAPVPTMNHGRMAPWEEICGKSAKVLSFIDLAGHERYLKTTVFGMTGCAPDFVMLMVGSNAGIVGMTKEHLGLSLALGVPVLVVITKIDMCPPNVLESTVKQLTKILKSPGCRKIPMFVKNHEDVVVTAGNFVSERICPIFQVSNVTGEGLDLLKNFLNVLPISQKYNKDEPVEYQITDTFSVPFVGTVVSGVVMSGIVHAGDQLYLGPDGNGAFQMVSVKSIQRKRLNVPLACAGQSASFGLKKIRRSTIRKGMVMLDKETTPPPRGCREFEAEILVLYHSTTIGHKYQAMLHCGAVRQTARVLAMDKPDQILRTGDRATVRFQFLHPAYLKIGARLDFDSVDDHHRYQSSDEEDFEEALFKPVTLPKPIVLWLDDRTAGAPRKYKTLIVGTAFGGSSVLHSIPEKSLLGSLILPGIDLKDNTAEIDSPANANCNIYESKSDPSVLLIPCNYEIKDRNCLNFAKAIMTHIQAERVIILDTLSPSTYLSGSPDIEYSYPWLRVLQTTHSTTADKIPTLEVPNLVQNLGAALIGYCEGRGMKDSCLLLSLQEHVYGKALTTAATLRGLKEGLVTLGHANIANAINVNKAVQQIQAKRVGSNRSREDRLYA